MATLERAGNSNLLLLAQHMARYKFASNYTKGLKVLDLGCGEAYGSQFLASSGSEVSSLDIAPEAVRFARQKGIRHVVRADARTIPFSNGSFDLVVSFEVFEHITEVEKYVREASRILKSGGRFVVSTPNVQYYPLAGMNPYHVKEYTYEEVKAILVANGFRLIACFAQETTGRDAAKLESSRILLSVMKWKRKLGFHGDLLPASLQKLFRKSITGSDMDSFSPDDFTFIENKIDSAELIYIAEAIVN